MALDEMVRRAQAGDAEAFEKLVSRYSGRIKFICKKVVKDDALAEDMCQNTLLKIWRRLSLFRGECAFTTWIHRIAVNECLMELRKGKTRGSEKTISLDTPMQLEGVAMSSLTIGDAMIDPRAVDAVKRIEVLEWLNALASGFRTIIQLHKIEGLEFTECAEVMGYSVGNAKSQFSKAKKRMKRFRAEGTRETKAEAAQRRRYAREPKSLAARAGG